MARTHPAADRPPTQAQTLNPVAPSARNAGSLPWAAYVNGRTITTLGRRQTPPRHVRRAPTPTRSRYIAPSPTRKPSPLLPCRTRVRPRRPWLFGRTPPATAIIASLPRIQPQELTRLRRHRPIASFSTLLDRYDELRAPGHGGPRAAACLIAQSTPRGWPSTAYSLMSSSTSLCWLVSAYCVSARSSWPRRVSVSFRRPPIDAGWSDHLLVATAPARLV